LAARLPDEERLRVAKEWVAAAFELIPKSRAILDRVGAFHIGVECEIRRRR
jgi:hypothetical protein